MKRKLITIIDSGSATVPGETKMSIPEIADLFGIFHQTGLLAQNTHSINVTPIIFVYRAKVVTDLKAEQGRALRIFNIISTLALRFR